jgi:hypothetical protein
VHYFNSKKANVTGKKRAETDRKNSRSRGVGKISEINRIEQLAGWLAVEPCMDRTHG